MDDGGWRMEEFEDGGWRIEDGKRRERSLARFVCREDRYALLAAASRIFFAVANRKRMRCRSQGWLLVFGVTDDASFKARGAPASLPPRIGSRSL
jgi:hypothetical protein